MIKKAKFYFPNGEEFESEIITESYQAQEILHNKLQAADGSCSFKIPFNVEIADCFKTQINLDKVKIEIKDEKNKNINTYYVKDSLTFEKGQQNLPISIQAISPSFFFNEDLPRTVVMLSKTVESIIKNILKEIKYKGKVSIPIMNTLPYFVAEEGENAKKVINELLFEYGYVGFFDADGNFTAKNLFDVPEETKFISDFLDGNSLRDKIRVNANEHEADFVSANFNKIEMVQNTLLFSDTQNADENNKCKIEIKPGYYLFESDDEKKSRLENGGQNEKVNLLSYDNTLGDVLYVSRIEDRTKFDEGITYKLSRFDEYGNDLVNQASLIAYNTNATSAFCRQLEIYGDAYVATSYDSVVSSKGTKEKQFDLKYVYDKETASTFAVNVANYYRWSNFRLTVKTDLDFELGTFLKVSDYGIGVYYGRIVSKKQTLKEKCIEYEIETISDYEPAQIDKSTSNINTANGSGTPGKPGVNGTKGEPGDSTLVYLERDNLVLGIDGDGFTVPYTYEIPIHIVANGQEMPCKVGNIQGIPQGMKIKPKHNYNSNGQGLIIEMDGSSGISESGSITIPIIYKEVEQGYLISRHPPFYNVFKNGKSNLPYGHWKYKQPEKITTFQLSLDWTIARAGVYRGTKDSISGFLIDGNYQVYFGDYFTWTSSKAGFWSSPYTSENVLEMTDEQLAEWNRNFDGVWCIFKPATVYKWNGIKWVEDKSNEHNSTAFSDIMATCTNVLKSNTSNVDEFLNNLVANTAFIKKLLAQEAFITNLFAKRILLTNGGSIEGSYTEDARGNPTSGFKLSSDGQLKCVNGIFKGQINATSGSFTGNIDSGPLHLQSTPAGSLSITMNGSEWGYELYTKLMNCDILPGTYKMSPGSMLGGKRIPDNANFSYKYWTTSASFDTSYRHTHIYFGYHIPIYVLLIPYWQNHYYHDHDDYRVWGTITTEYIEVFINGESWGTYTRNTINRQTSHSSSREDENRHYGTRSEESYNSGDKSGYDYYCNYSTNYNACLSKTNLIFGADTYTFKLTNLPNFSLVPSTAAPGTVYGHKGSDGHYYLCFKP